MELRTNRGKVSIQTTSTKTAVCRVSLAENVVVPPGHEMITAGKVKSTLHGTLTPKDAGIFLNQTLDFHAKIVFLLHTAVSAMKFQCGKYPRSPPNSV